MSNLSVQIVSRKVVLAWNQGGANDKQTGNHQIATQDLLELWSGNKLKRQEETQLEELNLTRSWRDGQHFQTGNCMWLQGCIIYRSLPKQESSALYFTSLHKSEMWKGFPTGVRTKRHCTLLKKQLCLLSFDWWHQSLYDKQVTLASLEY